MRRLLLGDCDQDSVLHQVDPTSFVEGDFEAEVIKALNCTMPEYMCGIYAGAYELEGERRVADLALIHRTLSHWYVVEVELAGHSLEDHVLPQARCFRYGAPQSSCVTSLVRGFAGLTRDNAEALLHYIPHYVAVVSNRPDDTWTAALNAVETQHLVVSVYKNALGRSAHEVEGRLTFKIASIGFAQYSAVDNCLRIAKGCGLPTGNVQIVDQFGNIGDWTIREEAGVLWIYKVRGPALIPHNEYVQLRRDADGRISIRLSSR